MKSVLGTSIDGDEATSAGCDQTKIQPDLDASMTLPTLGNTKKSYVPYNSTLICASMALKLHLERKSLLP